MPSQLLRGSAAEVTTNLSLAFNGTVPSNPIYTSYTAEFTRVGEFAMANSFAAAFSNTSNAALATQVLTNLGVTATSIGSSSYATLASAVETAFAAYPTARGQVALNLARLLSGLEADVTYGAAATAWNNNAAKAFTYSSSAANTASTTLAALNATPPVVNQTFTLTTSVDSITGGAGDDIINALAVNATTGAAQTSINSGDVIDGGAGNDTLNITATAANNTSLSGLTVSNVEVVNITGANNFGTVTSTPAAAVAGAAQVRVLDISAAQRTGEVQTASFDGMTVATPGNLQVTANGVSINVAVLAADGPQAIASKVKAGLEALTDSVASVTQSGATLTVAFKTATVTAPTVDLDPAAFTVATNLAASPVTLTTGAWATVTATTATTASDASTVTVAINGVNYTSAVITGTNGQLGTASAAPAIPTTVTTQGVTRGTETSAITFGDLTAGQSVTVNGLTLVAGNTTITAANVATFFGTAHASAAAAATAANVLGGSSTGANDTAKFTTAAAAGTAVTFTSAVTFTDVANIVVSTGASGSATAPSAPTVVTTNGSAGVTESSVVTFAGLNPGTAMTVAGLTLTAGTTAVTSSAMATFFAGGATPTGATAGGALAGFNAVASGSAVTYTSTTALTSVNDIVITTAGNTVAAAQATAQTNTRTAVKDVLTQVLGGTVTVGNGDDAGEIKLTSNAVGVDIPTITVTQGTTSRSLVDTLDGATVASAARTSASGATKQVMTITVADGSLAASDTFTVYINGQAYTGTVGLTSAGAAPTLATYASQVAATINGALGAGVATASGEVVTVTAPVAGTALPNMNVVGGTGNGSTYTFAQSAPNQAAVGSTSTTTAATISGANFTGATQVWLVGAGSNTTNLTVGAGQTAGLDAVTGLANTITFGTTGALAVKGSSGAATIAGAASGLAVSGTSSTGLTLTSASTGPKSMSFDMSGTTVVDVSAMAALTTVTSTGAGGVQVRNTGTKLASVTTGAGADSVRVNTTTVRDDALTTADETVNASVSTGAGADTVYVATTSTTAGFGTTTVDTGAGADTVYVQSLSTGTSSIATGDDNDTVHLNVALGSYPSLTINAGAGTDTLAMAGGAELSTVDYSRMNTALSGFETVRFTSATAGVDASKLNIGTLTGFTFTDGANVITKVGAGQTLTMAPRASATAASDFVPTLAASTGLTGLNATADGYVVGGTSGSTATVYGGALTVATSGSSQTLNLKGSSATVGVTATSTVAPTVTIAASDVQSLTVNLTSTRSATLGTGILATVNAGTITSTLGGGFGEHLEGLTSLKVNGSGSFLINTSGADAATRVTLTTIDLSGMTALSEINVTTGAITNPNVSTSLITLNGFATETVILGGAKDNVNASTSTVARTDTITGFQLTANSTTATLVDTTRSDVLNVGGGGFAKFTTTATTLIGALTEAGAATGARLVFQFGGDTYVYVDAGAAGLDDGDTLVKLTGNYDLDLLIQTGVLI